MACAPALLVQAFHHLHLFLRLMAQLVYLGVDFLLAARNMAAGLLVQPDGLHHGQQSTLIRVLRLPLFTRWQPSRVTFSSNSVSFWNERLCTGIRSVEQRLEKRWYAFKFGVQVVKFLLHSTPNGIRF